MTAIPEFMKLEPLPPHNQVFDVPDEVLDSVYRRAVSQILPERTGQDFALSVFLVVPDNW